MENFNENIKIKIIAFLSSIFLWMYVMAVVDPEETRLLENIPVRITNLEDLTSKNLMIYPPEELSADIFITGSLSNIQKVDKNDIKIFGEIKNPIEGKNEIYLSASTAPKVTYEIKDTIAIVNLDKVIEESKNVQINIIGDSNKNVDIIDYSSDMMKVSGPRTLVSQVDKIIGNVDVSRKDNDFTSSISVIPVDNKGKEIEGLTLEEDNVDVNVTLLKQKTVPIQLNIENDLDDTTENIEYKLTVNEVDIKGKSDIIDEISMIKTKQLKLSEIIDNNIKEIDLIIPEGVTSSIKNVGIDKLNTTIRDNFIFTKDELTIENIPESLDIGTVEIPEQIEITIEYAGTEGSVDKEQINLIVNLDNINEDGEIIIEYKSEVELIDIVINPQIIKVNE